jgi:hypothetical protein
LGLWFCYTSGLSLAACGITWIVLERRPSVRELLWALAGGVLGLLPWFAYNTSHHFAGLGRIVQLFGYGDPIDAWVPQSRLAKLADLLRRDLVLGLLLPFEERPPPWVTVTWGVAFAVPFALGLAFALRRVVSMFLPGRAPSSPLKKSDGPFDKLRVSGRRSLKSGRGTAHAEPFDCAQDRPVEARGGVFQRAARGPSGSQVESERNPADLLFIVYGLVFLTFFLASQFTIDPGQGPVTYRLFLPAAVILMVPAAHTVSRGLRSGSALRVCETIDLGPRTSDFRGRNSSVFPEARSQTSEAQTKSSQALRAVTLGVCGLYLIASAAGTVLLASRTPYGGTSNWHLLGQMVRGVFLHRKFETDLGEALVAARRVGDPQSQTRVLQGIGWGMQIRFEADGDLERVRRELAVVPMNERPAVVGGLRLFTKERVDWLRARREAPSTGKPLERLIGLQKFADNEWQQVQRDYRP